MSASITAAPARTSFGRIPSAFAALALVVVLAVSVALVAMNGTKAAAPAIDGAKGAPPPAVIDHGWSNGETVILPEDHVALRRLGRPPAGACRQPGPQGPGLPRQQALHGWRPPRRSLDRPVISGATTRAS